MTATAHEPDAFSQTIMDMRAQTRAHASAGGWRAKLMRPARAVAAAAITALFDALLRMLADMPRQAVEASSGSAGSASASATGGAAIADPNARGAFAKGDAEPAGKPRRGTAIGTVDEDEAAGKTDPTVKIGAVDDAAAEARARDAAATNGASAAKMRGPNAAPGIPTTRSGLVRSWYTDENSVVTWRNLSDAEWAVLEPFVVLTGPWAGRPPRDHRRTLDGIFWICRTGRPWRDLPEEFGKWNSVHRQYRRWQASGLWERVLEYFA